MKSNTRGVDQLSQNRDEEWTNGIQWHVDDITLPIRGDIYMTGRVVVNEKWRAASSAKMPWIKDYYYIKVRDWVWVRNPSEHQHSRAGKTPSIRSGLVNTLRKLDGYNMTTRGSPNLSRFASMPSRQKLERRAWRHRMEPSGFSCDYPV